MSQKNGSIGILAGSGPVAGLNAHFQLLKYCQQKYHAIQDTDYPSVYLHSIPLRGFSEKGIENESEVLPDFLDSMENLELQKCDAIVIACNTLHLYLPKLPPRIQEKVVNMIEITSSESIKLKPRYVGVLSSETSHAKHLYSEYFSEQNIDLLEIDDMSQSSLDDIIKNIMAGKYQESDNKKIACITNSLVGRGADNIIFGCTEISVIINKIKCPVPIIDSTTVAIRHAVDIAMKKNHN